MTEQTEGCVEAACEEYSRRSLAFLEDVAHTNRAQIARVAQAVIEAVSAGHLVYTAGAGHSIGGVVETFFRAGGVPFVYPLWHPRILPLNGAADSTAAERTEGLGHAVISDSPIGDGDVLFVFSNSGINFYPVEMARHALSLGATVVAVTSVEASRAAPVRAGARLADLADLVLDTGVPAGDVMWPPSDPAVAPLSSLAAAQLWNLVMVAMVTAEPRVDTWRSANVAGDDGHNAALTRVYAPRIPAM